ncbi:MAG: DNA repair protein RecO, partial [Turicibacter sp.]|nr:DNA repair protein RecO [Turicibacter sp.]
KRIRLFCKEFGILSVYAKGARRATSKFLAVSQMFTYGDYVLMDGGSFFSLNQGEILENFYPIRQDYEKLQAAQYILCICTKIIPAGFTQSSEFDEILRLVIKSLQYVSGADSAPFVQQTLQVFMFRFFALNGIAPEMDKCCLCGVEFPQIQEKWLFCGEGLLCADCQSKGRKTLKISNATRFAICHILQSDLNGAFLFNVNVEILAELTAAAVFYEEFYYR